LKVTCAWPPADSSQASDGSIEAGRWTAVSWALVRPVLAGALAATVLGECVLLTALW
jgi:hypothetical protein